MTQNEKHLLGMLTAVTFTAAVVIGIKDARIKELKTENEGFRRRIKVLGRSLTTLLMDPDNRITRSSGESILYDLKFEEQINNF